MKFSKLKLTKKPKLPELRMRLVLVYLIVLLPVIRLAQLYDTNPEQFWLEAPFLVSNIVAIIAGISALLALRSLELTRATVRPFLALQPGEVSSGRIQNIVTLVFHVKNTGPVPANLVTAEIAFFDDAEVIEEDNRGTHYPATHRQPEGVVVFPDAVYNLEKTIDSSHSIGKRLLGNMGDGKVKLRFRVTYRAKGREYVTVQTEKLGKEVAGAITRLPIQPQRWT